MASTEVSATLVEEVMLRWLRDETALRSVAADTGARPWDDKSDGAAVHGACPMQPPERLPYSISNFITGYRLDGRRTSTMSSMIWKWPMFSVMSGTPSTWAAAAMARSIWCRLRLPPWRVMAAAS